MGLFNAVNLELARGIIAGAEETGSPVIMGTAEVLLPYGPLEEVSYYLIPMAKKSKCAGGGAPGPRIEKRRPVSRPWSWVLPQLCMTVPQLPTRKM